MNQFGTVMLASPRLQSDLAEELRDKVTVVRLVIQRMVDIVQNASFVHPCAYVFFLAFIYRRPHPPHPVGGSGSLH